MLGSPRPHPSSRTGAPFSARGAIALARATPLGHSSAQYGMNPSSSKACSSSSASASRGRRTASSPLASGTTSSTRSTRVRLRVSGVPTGAAASYAPLMLGLPDGIRGCLFDLDGVLTQTAKVHGAAWKKMFDEYLQCRADREGEAFVPFDAGEDYNEYVDGKPRYEGVRSFLQSRGIELPDGTPDDPPSAETIDGLGNRKNELVLELIERDGVDAYEGSVRYVKAAREAGLRRAVVSSSTNCRDVLEAAGMIDLFEEIVDGNVARDERLKGKPAPDTFLAGARKLGLEAGAAPPLPNPAARGGEARPGGGRRRRLRERSGRGRGRAGGGVRPRRRRRPRRPRGRPARARRRRRRPGPRRAARPGGRPMIEHPAFAIEPWALRETALNLNVLAQSESLFALANGHIGLRGNLDEGEPAGLPGTYLNGFHEVRPLPYAESAYGNPEAGETVLNVTDGKLVRLLVDDELFDVRYGELVEHERVLDFRAGVLRRRVHWRSPAGAEVRIASTRIVSLPQRGAAAILYEVEPVGQGVRLVVQSELIANQDGQRTAEQDDPRAAAALACPLENEEHYHHDEMVLLVHRAKSSGLRMAAAMDHDVDAPDGATIDVEDAEDAGRVTIAADVAGGERLRVLKYLAYGWSGHRSVTSVRAQVRGSLAEARHTGWDGLCADQREYLDRFWANADVEVEGDTELQQAVRFCLFHVLQSGARAEMRAISAKGLTGPGYDGHAFWDTESFVLPVLTYTAPDAARDALRWRCTTAGLARERARQLGLAGAAFPWRTIAGRECSGYWPASTSAFHVNADIADAVIRYQNATGDERFAADVGLVLLVETARLWRSLGHHDAAGGFRIDGVTGPDEYSSIADNNVFTNLMAKRNLVAAADAAARYMRQARELGVDPEEAGAWRDAAADMVVPYDERLRGPHQAGEITKPPALGFAGTPPPQDPPPPPP